MRCLKCGKECGNENFCSNCGTPLVRSTRANEQKISPQNTDGGYNYKPYENRNPQAVPNGTYGNYTNPNPPQKVITSNIGIFAFILGLAGLFFSCVTSVGLILDIGAITCGIVGLTKKSKQVYDVTGIICGCIGLFLFFVSLFGGLSDPNTEMIEGTQVVVSTESGSDVSTEKTDTEDKQVEAEKDTETPKNEAKDSEKEFKKSCQKFNYKKIARNPDDYVGQNFKVTVQVYSISEGGLFTQAYMKAYTDDGSGTYFDNMIYIFDDQDEDSDSYVHVLEDDVITVYGTFEGMEDSTNFLNGEKSKDIALHMKYAKLIKE